MLTLHPKVAGGGAAGAVALIVLWLLSLFHIDVPAEVAAAFAVVLSSLGAYLAPWLPTPPRSKTAHGGSGTKP